MPNQDPNSKERELMQEIATTVKAEARTDYSQYNEPTYFDRTALEKFQQLALKILDLIQEQGAEKTELSLVAAAQEIKKAGDHGWNNANTFGFAFLKIKAPATRANPGGANPFAKLDI